MLVARTQGIAQESAEHCARAVLEPDRRREGRHVALLRVGVLHTRGNRDLCVVKNISAHGLSARAYREVAISDEVHIEFKSGELLSGRVVWTQNYNLGIKFPDPVDVEAVLASRWVREGLRRRNLPRIPISCEGRVKFAGRSSIASLLDISQGGARFRFGGARPELGAAVLALPGLEPIGGVIRWIADGQAGISFNECLSFEQLAFWIHDRRA